jgi:hypothetical protein
MASLVPFFLLISDWWTSKLFGGFEGCRHAAYRASYDKDGLVGCN